MQKAHISVLEQMVVLKRGIPIKSQGKARILLQMLDEILEEPSPGVAAAATTLIYTKAYGASLDSDKGKEKSESGSEEEVHESCLEDAVEILSDGDYSAELSLR